MKVDPAARECEDDPRSQLSRAQSLPIEVESKVGSVEGVTDVNVEVVWDPPWEPSMMSDGEAATEYVMSRSQGVFVS